jgi:putative ABC transport system permease protein
MIGKLAWRNTWFKPLSTVLSIILLMASVAIITVLILLQKQFEEQFSSNADDIDLVLGAQGSPLQLVLSSVYQVDAPPGNIDYTEAKTWMQNPFVKTAIPLAFGDNYLGFKIVGTTPDYIKKFGAVIENGKVFNENYEVVIGSEIANKLKIKVGDVFYGSHGDAKEGEKHEEAAYKVVGIASKTGKVIDNLILSNIQSVWAMHDVHEHEEGEEHHAEEVNSEEGKEITAVLLKFRNKMGIVLWPRLIAQNTKMQAASPAIEINRLFTLFGIGLEALTYLAYGIMLISGISIFIALFNTLKERKYEFALLRVNGASRFQLLKLVLIESLILCVMGFFFGTILGRVALLFISQSSDEEFKIAFNPFEFVWEKEGVLFIITIFVGVLAAVIPAVKAYRLNISKVLANA